MVLRVLHATLTTSYPLLPVLGDDDKFNLDAVGGGFEF
jgi:hypothetical protein